MKADSGLRWDGALSGTYSTQSARMPMTPNATRSWSNIRAMKNWAAETVTAWGTNEKVGSEGEKGESS